MPHPTLFDTRDDEIQPGSPLALAVEQLASAGSATSRGAIFTKLEVVEFILDLVGYTQCNALYATRALEPCFGGGDFLLPMIRRLLASWKRDHSGTNTRWSSLSDCLIAVELHQDTYLATREKVLKELESEGVPESAAECLADRWLEQGDFLLQPLKGKFAFVVGNPPYVRQELIPEPLLGEYRRRYSSLFDRADLYIPFFERCLGLLDDKGKLGFICADRWMKNRYGGPLRKLVAEQFSLDYYIDMTDTDAFHSNVSAYPAITVISKERSGLTKVAKKPDIASDSLTALAHRLKLGDGKIDGEVSQVPQIAQGSDPWLLDSSLQIKLLRRLEAELPTLEEAGCKVGIGVATGADKVFIAPHESLDVEEDRKLPLAMTADVAGGDTHWQGKSVVNPFADEGGLVNLDAYPKLKKFFESHRDVLSKRHCAKKSPNQWYRTIDRIWPTLASTPKLLVPDIKGEAHVVYEAGKLYPHHNLYYITSHD